MADRAFNTTELANYMQSVVVPESLLQKTGDLDILKEIPKYPTQQVINIGEDIKFRIAPTLTAQTRTSANQTGNYVMQTGNDSYKTVTFSDEVYIKTGTSTFAGTFASLKADADLMAQALKALREHICGLAFTKAATFTGYKGTYGVRPNVATLKSAATAMYKNKYNSPADLVQYLGADDWDGLTNDSSLPAGIREIAVKENEIPMLNGVRLRRSQYVTSGSQTLDDGTTATCYTNPLIYLPEFYCFAARPTDLATYQNIPLTDPETGIPFNIVQGGESSNGSNFMIIRTFVVFDFLRTTSGIIVKGGEALA